jgi:hypothetical protein
VDADEVDVAAVDEVVAVLLVGAFVVAAGAFVVIGAAVVVAGAEVVTGSGTPSPVSP